MKIQSLTTGVVGYSSRVLDRPNEQQSSSDPQDQQKHDEEQAHPEQMVPQEELQQAVEAFQADQQMQANGLNASVTGNGPGLRVVLKDGTGSVVKQLTGEEFIRLRATASRNGRIRGKILDQKL